MPARFAVSLWLRPVRSRRSRTRAAVPIRSTLVCPTLSIPLRDIRIIWLGYPDKPVGPFGYSRRSDRENVTRVNRTKIPRRKGHDGLRLSRWADELDLERGVGVDVDNGPHIAGLEAQFR